jgi:hypothetical protein
MPVKLIGVDRMGVVGRYVKAAASGRGMIDPKMSVMEESPETTLVMYGSPQFASIV